MSSSPAPTGTTPRPIPAPEHAHAGRLVNLDGWRAISILSVLACHMLPLGPKSWQLNSLAELFGMSLFFTLSGFLIASTLERNPTVASFLIRRICRIAPLALLGSLIYLLIQRKDAAFYPSHLLFYVNYDDPHLTDLAAHLWSLSVEVQFYLLAAVLYAALGQRSLPLLVALGIAITCHRVSVENVKSLRTHLRLDEILSGVGLALVYSGRLGAIGRWLARIILAVPLPFWAVAFAYSCHPSSGPGLYIRNYLAAGLVGRTLLIHDQRYSWLGSRPMRYIAEVSFAVYVIHPLSMYGWLGSGDKVVKYLKRPICFALTFGLAHLSTFHFERRWIAFGKRIAHRWDRRKERISPEGQHLSLDPKVALDPARK